MILECVNKAAFLAKVNVLGEDDCWEWQGGRKRAGYGSCGIKLAHRVAYTLLIGLIPEGLEVQHVCNNRACCNPKHLKAGTHRENMEYMALTGSNKGSKHYRAKINESDVKDIRNSNKTHVELARLYGLTPNNIYRIKAGVLWSHVT